MKINLFLKFLAIYFCMNLIACQKENNDVIFKGIVIDKFAKFPLQNIEVKVLVIKMSGKFYPTGQVVNTLYSYTDIEGKFEIQLNNYKEYVFTVFANRDHYNSGIPSEQYTYVQLGLKPLEIEKFTSIGLEPSTYLGFILNNSKNKSIDSIQVQFYYQKSTFKNIDTNNNYIGAVYAIYKSKELLKWNYFSNGVISRTFEDSVFINSNGTTYDTLIIK